MMVRNRFPLVALVLVFSPAILSGQSADQLYAGGRQAFTDGLWPTASSQFSRLLREYPEDHRADSATYMAAVAHFNAGEYRRSIDFLSTFSRRYPDSAWNRRVAYWEGMAHFELGEWKAAAGAFLRQSELTEEVSYRERSLLYLGASRENMASWEQAEEAYSLIVEIGRDYDTLARATFRLGQIRLAQGRPEEALDDFSRLAYDYSSSPVAEDTLFWLAESRRILGRNDEALADYRNYLSTVYDSPYRSQALLEAAGLASSAGEDDEALAYLDLRDQEWTGGTDDHRDTVLRIRAPAYLRTGRLEPARRTYTAILNNPQNRAEEQTAAFNLAQTWIGTDRAMRALPYLVRSSKGPNDAITADALYLAGTVALLGDDSAGGDYLETLARQFPDDTRREEALKLAVKTRQDAGDASRAVENLNHLVSDYPESADADSYLFLRGELHLELGEETPALADYAAVVREHPQSPLAVDSHSRIGFVYAGRGEYGRAAKHYLRAADTAGGVNGGASGRMAIYSAAVALLNAGERERAVDLFENLVDFGPSEPWGIEAAFHLGETRYELGDYAGARQAYALVDRYGDGVKRFEALYGIAWTWFRESRWDMAEAAFRAAQGAAPDPENAARSLYRVGLTQASDGRWAQALESYDAALAQGVGSWREETLYQKAWALLNLGRIDEANLTSRELAREFPASELPPDLPFRMGENALAAGNFTQAVEWYDGTVRDFPGTEQASRARLRAALAAGKSGDSAKSASRYGGWIFDHIHDPGAVAAVRSWAQALENAGDPDLAAQALLEISRASGENSALAAPIVLAWARITGIPADAVGRLESIAKDESLPAADRAEALLLRAHRYRMDGRPQRSRQIYQVLIRDVPGHIGAQAQEGLARSYADEGKVDEAAEAYLAVSYLFPDQADIVNRARREAERLYRAAGRNEEADKIHSQMEEPAPSGGTQ